MTSPNAVTAPIELSKENAMESLKGRLFKIQEANRRYEACRPATIKMRETNWKQRNIKATWTQFSVELVKQDYRCACCKSDIDERACIHTNPDGTIRGLVCYRCNLLLAYSHDDSYVLLQVIVYLLGSK